MTKASDDGASLVSIGQLAKAAGVSSRTIRYYEELGILPEPRRSPGGTRKYPREYGRYIAAALALKDLGFRLEEVKPLARLAAGRQVSQGQRDAAARLVESKIETLARQVTVLRRLADSVRVPDGDLPVSAVLGSSLLEATVPEATGTEAAAQEEEASAGAVSEAPETGSRAHGGDSKPRPALSVVQSIASNGAA
jgi:MerR family transcriptional regulator, copper efflux regulator